MKWMVLRWRRKSRSRGVFSPQKMEGGTLTFKRMARETSSGRVRYPSTLLWEKKSMLFSH